MQFQDTRSLLRTINTCSGNAIFILTYICNVTNLCVKLMVSRHPFVTAFQYPLLEVTDSLKICFSVNVP